MGKIENIKTERLILRELTIDDFDSVHEIKSNLEVVKYLTWGPNNEEETRKSLIKQLGFQYDENRKMFVLAVEKEDFNSLIGNALLMVRDEEYKIAEIGYFLHPSEWRKGYGSEVVKGLLQFGFLKFNLHRIFATCDTENTGSIKVLTNSGFRLEGHLIQNLNVKGQWRDNFLFAILASEYFINLQEDLF